MTRLGVLLRERDSGQEVGRYALPPHVAERLIAATHLDGVAAGQLPNDGLPLEDARVSLSGEIGDDGESPALDVTIRVGDSAHHKRFARESISNDAQVMVSRLARGEEVPTGLYEYALIAAPEEPAAASGLKVRPFPRALPALPTLSLRDASVALPRCPHPTIFLPAKEAQRLVDQATATPDVEIGALLVVTPFLIKEAVPHRLGIYVRQAAPLENGTVGEALRVRITPAAFAAVKVDETKGLLRGGLAHSHPFGAKDTEHGDKGHSGTVLFLSPDDLAFATGFFWRPFQFQLVVDAGERDPERALGAFCWIDGRLVRVCFRIMEKEPMTWEKVT
jgi:hypothetical protein